MQLAQTIGVWFAAIALAALVVIQLNASPPLATYQTVVASFADERLGDAMMRLGPLGWRFTSCRRASTGSGSSPTFGYECFLERGTRSTPDESLKIMAEAVPGYRPSPEPEATWRGGDAAGELPPTCEKYMKTMKACLDSMGDAGNAVTDAFNRTTKAWEDAAKAGNGAALEAGCKAAWDAAKGSMPAMCPGVRW